MRTLLWTLSALLLVVSCSGSPPDGTDGGTSKKDGGEPPPPALPLVVAHAGPDRLVRPGATVVLEGGGSFTLGQRVLDLLWTQVSGPEVTLSNPASPRPQLQVPLAAEKLIFQLEVDDGQSSAVDFVTLVVRDGPGGRAPFAIAGPDLEVTAGETFTVDARDSVDPDGDTLTFLWRRLDRPEATGVLSTEPTLTFAPDKEGALVVRLEVNDGLLMAKDDLVVYVDEAPSDNAPPSVVLSGPDTAEPGTWAVLEAAAADPNDNPPSLVWTQVDGPPAQIEADSRRLRFLAPDRVSLFAFRVEARDARVSSAPAYHSVKVTAGQGNTAPIADAGADLTVSYSAVVTLDGTGSSDPDGVSLITALWVQLAGPPVTLVDPASLTTTFVAPDRAGTLSFSLTVSDGTVWSAPSFVEVTVGP